MEMHRLAKKNLISDNVARMNSIIAISWARNYRLTQSVSQSISDHLAGIFCQNTLCDGCLNYPYFIIVIITTTTTLFI